jgi:hypothetical protein
MIRTIALSILLASPILAQTDTSLTAPPASVERVDSIGAVNQPMAAIPPAAGKKAVAWPAWVMVFILLSAGAGLLCHCRPRQALQVPIMSRIPENIPPALVGYLLMKKVPYRALLSTLLDLASRRFLVIRIDRSELILELNRSYWRKNAVHMHEFEDRVIRFVFGSRDKVSTKDFHEEVLAGFANRWNRKVRMAGAKESWFDSHRMAVHSWFQIGTGFFFAASLVLAVWSGWWVLLPAAVSAALFWMSKQTACRSESGEIRYKQWIAFREYFQQRRFRNAEPQSLIDKIETYVLYLPVLDVEPEVFQELFLKVPAFSILSALPWLVFPETPVQSSEVLIDTLVHWIERLSRMDNRNWKRRILKTA